MKDKDVSDQSDDGWFCEHLRVTIFTHPFEIEDADSWWSDTTGELPATSTVERKTGKRADDGPYRDRILSLKVQATRIDWVLGADVANATSGIGFSSIGTLPDSLDVMREVIDKWIKLKLPPVIRIAIGTAVMLPVSDRAGGYRALQPLLSNIKLNSQNTREFEYQINRPRKSTTIPDLEVNRLCRWSVAAYMVQAITVGQPAVAPTVHSLACRIEPDVNTDASRTDPIPTGQLLPLYNELASLATELVTEGDIA